MPNYTPHFNLKKPIATENYNVEDQNGNMDIVDTQLKANKTAIDNHKMASILDHPDDSVTDAKIGDRTIDQAVAPSNKGRLAALLGGLANMIKAITGKADWKTAPVKSLEALNNEKAGVASSNTFTTKQTIQVNPGLQATYGTGHLELRSTNGDDVLLGFHRVGLSATALVHKDNVPGLSLVDSSDNLTDFRAATVYSNGVPVAVAGSKNTDVNKTKAVTLQVDTRTLVLTYTGEQLTKVEEKDGANAVKTTNLSYNGDGTVNNVVESAGGTTVTKTLGYTSNKLTSVTKAVT